MSNDYLLKEIYWSLIFILISKYCVGNNYYADPSSSSLHSVGSFESPWKSIQEINNYNTNFHPGDSIFFKRGESFSGALLIHCSGIKSKPIVFTAYGEGPAPVFTNFNKQCIIIQQQKYIVIDGIRIYDKRISPDDHKPIALVQYGIIVDKSSNCVIKNCDISLVGIGIALNSGSDSTAISKNIIHNLRMIRNTLEGNDDFGANGIVIGSSSNKILHNRFESCWGYSIDYEYDGGAIEFFGNQMNDNSIMYNTSINCAGFIEMGSVGKGQALKNVIAYNKIINNGYTGVFHNGAKFNTRIKKTKYFNNAIIETKRQFANPKLLFWVADTTATDVIEFRNNIVWLETGIAFGSNSKQMQSIEHSNNIFKFLNGSSALRKLHATDIISYKGDIFCYSKGDVEKWDLHLTKGSCAIDKGIELGITKDLDGTSIQGKPDVGIYEYSPKFTSNKKPAS